MASVYSTASAMCGATIALEEALDGLTKVVRGALFFFLSEPFCCRGRRFVILSRFTLRILRILLYYSMCQPVRWGWGCFHICTVAFSLVF